MKGFYLVLILIAASARADWWVNLPEQKFLMEPLRPQLVAGVHNPGDDVLYANGWRVLAAADMATPPSNGYQRIVRMFSQHPTLTNNAIELVVDEPIPPTPFQYGIDVEGPASFREAQAGVFYIFDKTGTNGIALAAVGNQLVVVDGWGSPQHSRARVESDANDHVRVKDEIMQELRNMRKSLTNEINDAQELIDQYQFLVSTTKISVVTNGFTTAAQRKVIESVRSINLLHLQASIDSERERIDVLREQRDLIGAVMDVQCGTNRPSRDARNP
jgi:hypothetical protein